ncbi:MAG TPA: TIGR00269 family protein [Alphaproteobacteria bacterium]|nr:TIGR00269 family protein [Alphaproteobacteria bacterium]
MQCSKCEKKAVHAGQGQNYCKGHFLEYFESKVLKTISKYNLIQHGDKVCVATSGGKDSLAVLYVTNMYCKKHGREFFVLAVDEGIKGYRDHTLDDLKAFCDKYEVEFKVVSFKEKYGNTLDNIKDDAIQNHNKKPCTVCGVFRRTLLNKMAREYGATKLVTGHNLDDESQSFMMNVMLGNMSHNASLGPITGLNDNDKFVPRVKPLYFMLEKETRLYAFLKGFKIEFSECPNINLSFRASIRDELNAIDNKLPGAKNGIVNSFLEILPLLKEHYKTKKSTKTFKYCTKCGDPCSGDICNACKMSEELNLKPSIAN